jgi:dihydroorotase-like cyclic amidohydrolase
VSTENKKTLIKGATLADGRTCDVLLENGVVQAVAPSLSDTDAVIFEATSMILL